MAPTPRSSKITSFFKPQPSQTSQPSQASRPAAASQPARESSGLREPSPLPPSSPANPGTPEVGRSRDAIIAASDEDDEGESSDDDLEDLIGKFDPRRNAAKAPAQPSRGAPETPKAKRTMTNSFHSSPLTIQSKHQFDMKALAKDFLQDERTHASSLRNKEAADEAAGQLSRDTSTNTLYDIVQDQDGANAHKVLRAVQRSAPAHSQSRYCFFSSTYTPPQSTVISKKVSTGPWRLLTRGDLQTREQYLTSGLPQTILGKVGGLPEELFEWMLDELCIQKSSLMQKEYVNILSNCPDLVERLVTPERLEGLFLRLGANKELATPSEQAAVSSRDADPYQDRDWGCLQSFIELLAVLASERELSQPSIVYAIGTMLRMSMDKFLICRTELLVEHENTIQCLLDGLKMASWEPFCLETATALHRAFEAQSVRINSLLCLPISSKRAHELRRRLAIAYLFNKPTLAAQHPDTVITMRSIIERLSEDDFTVNSETDFEELRARILLLNIAVDDGSFVATADAEHEKNFNADVDELATRLREIWRKINDAGMKLVRTEAKSVIEWVQQRILYSVRTRRKARRSVFDTAEQKEDPFLPQQQNYMRNFLGKPVAAKPKASTPPVTDKD